MPKAVGKLSDDRVVSLTNEHPDVILGSLTGAGMRRLLLPDDACCTQVAAVKAAIQSLGGEPTGLAVGVAVSRGLAAIGVTQDRVASLLGPCSCEERRQLLDRAGWAIQDALGVGAGNE